MKKIKNGILMSVCLLGLKTFAQTEGEKGKFSYSGSVDVYFRTNLNGINKSYSDTPDQLLAPTTAYADKTGFALGMANIAGTYEYKNVGAVVDLVFGPRGKATIFNSAGSSNILNQAYVYWKTSDKLTLTFGQFNTFFGYEVISPAGNFNYSTSYLFSYGPFNHTGIKANYQIDDKWSALLMVANPSDILEYNSVGTYHVGGQLGYTASKSKFFLNLMYGDFDGKLSKYHNIIGDVSKGNTFMGDLNGSFSLGSKTSLGWDAEYSSTAGGQTLTSSGITSTSGKSAGFYGGAIYPQYKFSDNSAIGLRGEYFKEFNGGVGALRSYDVNGDANVLGITMTGDFKIGNLSLKPEFRYDKATQKIFTADESGKPQDNLFSVLFATVYKF